MSKKESSEAPLLLTSEGKDWGGSDRRTVARDRAAVAGIGATPGSQPFSSPNTPDPVAKVFPVVSSPDDVADSLTPEEEVEKKETFSFGVPVAKPDGEGTFLLGTVEWRVETLNGGTKLLWLERKVAFMKASADLPLGSIMV